MSNGDIHLKGPGTLWRIHSMQLDGHQHRGLKIMLVVDTKAPAVLEAIEQAAFQNKIDLERVSDIGAKH